MKFAIFEDLVPNTSAVKIHISKCHHYVMHEETKTTRWHEIEHFDDAQILATQLSSSNKKGYRLAKCCTTKNLDRVGER